MPLRRICTPLPNFRLFAIVFAAFIWVAADVAHAQAGGRRVRPINVIIVVDQSGSMFLPRNAPVYLPLRRGIGRAVRNNIQVNDSVLIIGGSDEPSVIAYKRIAGAGDKNALLRDIAKLAPVRGAWTDFGAWLDFTVREAQSRFTGSGSSNRGKTMLYIITDGENAPRKTSKYYRSGGDLPDELKQTAQEMRNRKWAMSVIGIGDTDGAVKLGRFIGGTSHGISAKTPGRDFSTLVADTLRNEISVLRFTSSRLLRRGARNEIRLKLLGGWDYGQVDLREARLRIPPGGGREYKLDIKGGAFRLGPKEHRTIRLSFKLPSGDLPDTLKGKPIDGKLSLEFKPGARASFRNPFISFYTEHWFKRYRIPVFGSTGLLILFLLVYRWILRRDLYVKVVISGQEPTPPVRLREGQNVVMGKAANPPAFRIERPTGGKNGILKLKKQKRKLVVMGAAGEINLRELGLNKGDDILKNKKPLEVLGVQVRISRTNKPRGGARPSRARGRGREARGEAQAGARRGGRSQGRGRRGRPAGRGRRP